MLIFSFCDCLKMICSSPCSWCEDRSFAVHLQHKIQIQIAYALLIYSYFCKFTILIKCNQNVVMITCHFLNVIDYIRLHVIRKMADY